MAAVQAKIQETPKNPSKPAAVAVREPIWVYEASPGVSEPRGAEEIAIKCLRAKPGGSGPAGNSYALVTRDADNKLLPLAQLQEQVQTFIECVRRHPQRQFRLLASPYLKSDEEFEQFTELFRNVPAHCELPGRCQELLGRLKKTRIIVLDANVKEVDEVERKRTLNQYFSANEGLWGGGGIEIVSFGLSHTIVRNDKYAKGRGYGHHLAKVNPKIYGKLADQARQVLSITYANKLVCFSDPMGTSTGFHMTVLKLASAAALQVDDVLLG